MDDIFLSYSRKDTATAEQLKRRIEHVGYSVWMDTEDIRGGDLWRKKIVEGIEGCRLYIIVLTEHSIVSENVRRELDLARAKKSPILPVYAEPKPTQISREMEYQLVGLQTVDEDLFDDPQRAEALLNGLTLPPHTVIMPIAFAAFLEPDRGAAIPLVKEVQVVGRGPHVDIDLSGLDRHRFVSKRHAELCRQGGTWHLVTSEFASNPTLVNGKLQPRDADVELSDGDLITFADVTLRFVQK
jgi:hypothetical protein